MRPFTRRLALAAAWAATLGFAVAGVAQAQGTVEDMALGNPKAKITVIEYGSLACSHCADWDGAVWPKFKAKYVDTGKVRFVFREFLTANPDLAVAGALVARCAGKDKFFAVVEADFLALRQAVQGKTTVTDILRKAIEASGLDDQKIQACVTDEKAIDALYARTTAWGETDKVTYTPFFLINGKAIGGDPTLERLDAAIAAASR